MYIEKDRSMFTDVIDANLKCTSTTSSVEKPSGIPGSSYKVCSFTISNSNEKIVLSEHPESKIILKTVLNILIN